MPIVKLAAWGSAQRATRSNTKTPSQERPSLHGVKRYLKVTGDVHLLLLDGDKILLGRRQNTGYEDGAYHVPSGHLEAGESMTAALIREAKEEIGVTISPEAIEFAHVMHNSSSGGRIAFFFTVRHWEGTPENREPDKCGEIRWFPLNALPDHMIAYCRTALDHVTTDQPFSIYGW